MGHCDGCFVHQGRGCMPWLRVLAEDDGALTWFQERQQVLMDTPGLLSAESCIIDSTVMSKRCSLYQPLTAYDSHNRATVRESVWSRRTRDDGQRIEVRHCERGVS